MEGRTEGPLAASRVVTADFTYDFLYENITPTPGHHGGRCDRIANVLSDTARSP